MNGIQLIKQEREDRFLKEGITDKTDDTNKRGELAAAAAFYALVMAFRSSYRPKNPISEREINGIWPFARPPENADRIRCLTIAGAMISAEIDRLQRSAEKSPMKDIETTWVMNPEWRALDAASPWTFPPPNQVNPFVTETADGPQRLTVEELNQIRRQLEAGQALMPESPVSHHTVRHDEAETIGPPTLPSFDPTQPTRPITGDETPW